MKARDMKYFTRDEALEKVGKRIRAIREFAWVPAGTTGTVEASYRAGPGEYGVDVAWDLPGFRTPLVDGFSKGDYVFLEEI